LGTGEQEGFALYEEVTQSESDWTSESDDDELGLGVEGLKGV
jgi:hypothetical protein